MPPIVAPFEKEYHTILLRKLRKRTAARNALSEWSRELLDTELSALLTHDPFRWPYQSRRILHLLNLGATACKLDDYELGDGNVGDAIRYLFCSQTVSDTLSRRIFLVLKNIVASPCTSWLTQRTYVGNGGLSSHYFILELVLMRRFQTLHGPVQSENTRYRAWWLYKSMVWRMEEELHGFETVGLIPAKPEHVFERSMLGDAALLLRHEERESDYTKNTFPCALDVLFLRREFAPFFAQRALHRRLNVRLDVYDDFAFTRAICKSSLLILPVLWQNVPSFSCSVEPVCMLNALSANREKRKSTLQLLRYAFWRKWFLQHRVLEELCRRKERVVFEELLKLDEVSTMQRVPYALQILQSSKVRGCKHKLIKMLAEALEAYHAKEAVRPKARGGVKLMAT